MGAVLICALAVFSATTATASADALPQSLLISDQAGINVGEDGDYFIDATGLRPGDVLTKDLIITNTEQDIPFELYMTAEPMDSTGPLDLLQEVNLTLTLDGVEFYNGKIRGDEGINMILNPLDLGTYTYGDTRTLAIKLEVNKNMQLFYAKSEATIGWHFYAAKAKTDTPPNTGLTSKTLLMQLSLILIFATVALLVFRETRQGQVLVVATNGPKKHPTTRLSKEG
jgi:hypothetical protein